MLPRAGTDKYNLSVGIHLVLTAHNLFKQRNFGRQRTGPEVVRFQRADPRFGCIQVGNRGFIRHQAFQVVNILLLFGQPGFHIRRTSDPNLPGFDVYDVALYFSLSGFPPF